MIKKKEIRHKLPITGTREEISINLTAIERIINNYEQLYANKFNNLDKMEKFLENANY